MQRTPQGNQTNAFDNLHTRLAHTQLTKAYMTCSITRWSCCDGCLHNRRNNRLQAGL